MLPDENLPRTQIETRIELRLKMMLTNTIPQSISSQCEDRPEVTCAQMLYRTVVYAGPASKEDVHKLMDILTRPRTVELGKLYDVLIQFRYARTRLKKYGYREPEPSQLFETLRGLLTTLTSKDVEPQFAFQLYITTHASINGSVDEKWSTRCTTEC